MEELLLCALFSYNKLNVVEQQDVVVSELLPEALHGAGVEGVDQLIGKVL